MKSLPPPRPQTAVQLRPPGYGPPQGGPGDLRQGGYRAPVGAYQAPGFQAPRGAYRAPGSAPLPRADAVPGGAFSLRGVPEWENPQFNPDRNKSGYTRYDHTQRGSGLNTARTFADGARAFDVYNALNKNQPGYTHAENARKNLAGMGVTVDTATDEQKFDALDLAHRGAMFKNKRPKRKFSLGKFLMQAAPTVIGVASGNPWLAAASAGASSAAQGGGFPDIIGDMAASYAGGKIGGHLWGNVTGATQNQMMQNALRASKQGYI